MFTTRLFLLLPFQWRGWRKTSALPTALTQLTRRSGFWFLSLYSQVCSFPFLLHVWLQLSIKRYTKAASLTDLFNSLPSLSYVRLPTLLQRTCAEIKPFIIVSIWIIKNVAFFLFIYLVVLCWVKWPPAIYSKAWHILKPPLSKTDLLVLMLIYMKYNRNFTAILHFVFSSLNEFAIWLNQRVLVWIFIYSFSLARSHHPSLHVIMTPSPKSSAGGYVGLKKGTPSCLFYMKFPIWVMVKPELFDDSTWGTRGNNHTWPYSMRPPWALHSSLFSKGIFHPLVNLKFMHFQEVVWKRQLQRGES